METNLPATPQPAQHTPDIHAEIQFLKEGLRRVQSDFELANIVLDDYTQRVAETHLALDIMRGALARLAK